MAMIITALISLVELAFFAWFGMWRLQIPLSFASVGSSAFWFLALFFVALTIVIIISRPDLIAASFGGYALLILLPLLFSSPLFHAARYARQLDVPEGTSFKESDLPPFDPSQLPWVNEDQAAVLGDKMLGQLGAIGSSAVIGEYTRQEVGGKLYLVAPILHKGFFAYNRNKEGTPGYIMVSMTNSDDVRLVTQAGGKDIRIRVQPAGHAAWGDKLERIIYRYDRSALKTPWRFEVDDDLHPYWVVPEYRNTIGWFGPEVSGIFVVDAISGELHRYSVDLAPEWIDRIQPADIIEKQLASWGAYSGGFWNTVFGKIGLLQSDPGNTMVYRDGDCYLFDSLTSYEGADESTVGFVLVNLRTKKTEHFNLAGADEWAAQGSALGDERVKHLRYSASFPLPTMVEGQPTYFFGLQDPQSRITKMFALVNIARHQVVGIGNTISAAKIDYMTKARGSGAAALNTPQADLIEISGRVERWSQYTQGGESHYSFIVDSAKGRILTAGSTHIEAPLTQAGDRVQVQVFRTDESVWSVYSFDNLEINQSE